jgi:hypothetical protein
MSILLIRVPEGKVAKNRVHLDVHVDGDHKLDEVDRLTGLGAELFDIQRDRGSITYVMRDPEGNEFCWAELRLSGRAG